jgi:hypothetical protein
MPKQGDVQVLPAERGWRIEVEGRLEPTRRTRARRLGTRRSELRGRTAQRPFTWAKWTSP